jgi:exonuclease SbcC
MSVLLDFSVGERLFRVARTGRRGRSGEALLEEILDGEEKPLASGIRSVDEEIVQLLGLHYDAFTQAVVLPQGEFARFLKSQPRERREILRDLLRLQVYERMRREAFEKARELDMQLRGIGERLEQDYQAATPETLEALRLEEGQQDEELEKTSSVLGEKRDELERRKILHSKTRKLEEGRAYFKELSQRAAGVEKVAGRLDAAKRAQPLTPLFETADNARKRALEDEERAASASVRWDDLRKRREEDVERLKSARKSAEEIPVLRHRLRALDEVKGLMAPRKSIEKRLVEAEEKQNELEREIADVKVARVELARRVGELQEQLQAVSEELKNVGYDPELEQKLDEVRNEAVRLQDTRRAAEQDAEAAARANRKQEMLASRISEVEKAAHSEHEELKKATHRTSEAESTLREAEQELSAAHLRQHLQVGKKCPVCSRLVKKLPPPLQMTFLDALRSQFAEVKEAEAVARHVSDEKSGEAARARADLDAARRDARDLGDKAEASKGASRELERVLLYSLGSAVENEEGDTIEARVLAAAKRLGEVHGRFESITSRGQELEKELVRSQSELDSLGRRVEALAKQERELGKQIEKDKKELAQIDARVAKVTDVEAPDVEAEKLAARISRLEQDLKGAEALERKSGTEAASAQKAAEEAKRTAQESAEQAKTARERLGDAVSESGFEDEEAARCGVLEPAEQSQLEEEVTAFRQAHHTLEKQVADLEREVGGEVTSAEDLASVEAQWSRTQRDYEALLQKKAALGQQVKDLEKKIEKATELCQKRDVFAREHTVYRRLADDLRSEHFQAYLLEEAFHELVGGASGRLKKLSGRYTLEYLEDNFFVLDHDNAGERRSADTLSGGETFLASLALALELSEQVQRAAGAVNLDSLFIDEGFGTLDPETLDTVTAAIETLPVAGRMVGIITHIPELTERLPACIRVEKTPEGSRIKTW